MTEPLNLKDLLNLGGADVDGLLRTAVEHQAAGRLREAEAVLSGLMTLAAGDVRPVKLLASVLVLQNRQAEAAETFERAHQLDPDDPFTLVALGELKLKAGDLAGALPYFDKLFLLDPKSQHPAANRGRALIKEFHRLSAGRGQKP